MNSKKIRTYLLKEIVYVNIKLIIPIKTLRWVYYEKQKVDPHVYSVKFYLQPTNQYSWCFCSHLCIYTKWQTV